MTALELNPDLFVVARQESPKHDDLFDTSRADLVARRSQIVARRILAVATTPLLPVFLEQIQRRSAGQRVRFQSGDAPRHETAEALAARPSADGWMFPACWNTWSSREASLPAFGKQGMRACAFGSST